MGTLETALSRAMRQSEERRLPLDCRNLGLTGWLTGWVLPQMHYMAGRRAWPDVDKMASYLPFYENAQQEAAAYLLALDPLENLGLHSSATGEDVRATCQAWLADAVTLEEIRRAIITRGLTVAQDTKNGVPVRLWWWIVIDQHGIKNPDLLRETQDLKHRLLLPIIEPQQREKVLSILGVIRRVTEMFPYAKEHFRVGVLEEFFSPNLPGETRAGSP